MKNANKKCESKFDFLFFLVGITMVVRLIRGEPAQDLTLIVVLSGMYSLFYNAEHNGFYKVDYSKKWLKLLRIFVMVCAVFMLIMNLFFRELIFEG